MAKPKAKAAPTKVKKYKTNAKTGMITEIRKDGSSSVIGSATATQTGDTTMTDGSGVMPTRLVPTGKNASGYMSYGYVPTGAAGTAGSNINGLGTPYAKAGGGRAGRVDSRTAEGGWAPTRGLADEYGMMRAAIDGTKYKSGKHDKPPKGANKPGGNHGDAGTTAGGIDPAMLPLAASQGIYAEADISRTGTAAAQGKAYQAMFGTDAGTVLGATSVPSVAQTADTAEETAGGAKPGKKPGKKLTKAAKAKSSPGGKKVTTRERARIKKAKGK